LAEQPRRRVTDGVDPDVMLAIREQAADNRHVLRNEMTAAMLELRNAIHDVGQKVEVGNLADVTERARMAATLESLREDTKDLRTEVAGMRTEHAEFKRGVEKRLRAVEDAQNAAAAQGNLRGTLWRATGVVCTVLLGIGGLLAAVIH
jgi:hypothetical protein